MDVILLFYWGEERVHAKPLHLSSGRQISSVDVATGSSQGLVLAQCELVSKMCILMAGGPAGCPLGVLSPAHSRASSAPSLTGNHLPRSRRHGLGFSCSGC